VAKATMARKEGAEAQQEDLKTVPTTNQIQRRSFNTASNTGNAKPASEYEATTDFIIPQVRETYVYGDDIATTSMKDLIPLTAGSLHSLSALKLIKLLNMKQQLISSSIMSERHMNMEMILPPP
jgi:hypothetical protein